MPCLLYCVTQPNQTVNVTAGVCNGAVQSREMLGARVYWSDIVDADECLGSTESLKEAAVQFHQVVRQILEKATPIPFRFPTLLENEATMEEHLATEQELYLAALKRIGDAVQYEVVGSWAADEQTDLATPVSGREYLERRSQATGRIAAIDSKLKSVTGDTVREWRARQERKSHRWFALVPRESRDRFIASLRSAGASKGVRLRLSGPWPPAEFVTPREDHG
jgi:hypothetical protein